jgi:hypothetical protein
MASDRSDAKHAIEEPENNDPELNDVLQNASRFRIDLVKENNRHKEAMAGGERGFFGRALGGERMAPTIIAFLATTAGLLVWAWCLFQSSVDGQPAAFWAAQGERALAFAGASLGFIFGRGLK